jgi:hypothetical protein
MIRSWMVVILTLCSISMSVRVCAQTSNSTTPDPVMWPGNPPVGIGTQLSVPFAPQNALHIHYNSADGFSKQAILRLSEGTYDTTEDYGILGLMPGLGGPDTLFSSVSRGDDQIMHEHQDGDIIITNWSPWSTSHQVGGAIRFSTTGDTMKRSVPSPGHHDLERLTINGNGNVGIDLPPETTGSNVGLDTALDQVQIGGGILPPVGYAVAMPGLTMYGGNRFEGMPKIGGDFFPVDWRYIAFNQYTDHSDSSATRSKRIALMSSSVVAFAANDVTIDGGMIDLHCVPYTTSTGLNVDTAHGLQFHIMGSKGIEFWCDVSQADIYHHLFDVYRPGYLPSPLTRNTNGLFFHHTPVYIGSDAGGSALVDFQNLTNVHPNLGDDTTWMLAVNGSALFKEAWVNSADWPDYVFLPDFKLMSISDFGNFLEMNHHLPEIPNAKKMNAGIPLGQTEEELTKQVEEMARYIVQLNKEVEALKSEMQDLKNGGK